MSGKIKAGIIGCTGMVGQRFALLLDGHPDFKVTCVAASERSAGRTYKEAVEGRWKMSSPLPSSMSDLIVKNASDISSVASQVDFVFCAVDMKKDEIKALEEVYAKAGIPVVSNNSANRNTPDVPMVIPEINPEHLEIIKVQRARLGTNKGFIAVKPNCSIQSYVPLITPLLKYKPTKVVVTTFQAISGAGKTFTEWPEMMDNVNPYIGGEEEKSQEEPHKIWGEIKDGKIVNSINPLITAQCIRVPVTDGHLAAVYISFENKPSKEEILSAWENYTGEPQALKLHSAPERFITYFEEDNRPQTKHDRDIYGGMGITAGRLRKDSIFDYKFVGLSHNTLRGAAGGAVLIAEMLAAKGYITKK